MIASIHIALAQALGLVKSNRLKMGILPGTKDSAESIYLSMSRSIRRCICHGCLKSEQLSELACD
jgi:hypothetical protein